MDEKKEYIVRMVYGSKALEEWLNQHRRDYELVTLAGEGISNGIMAVMRLKAANGR